MRRVLIAGCGYVGKLVARRLAQAGAEVTGIVSSEQSAEALRSEPFRVMACDISEECSLDDKLGSLNLHGTLDLIVHCASSNFGGAEQYRRVYLKGAMNLLSLKPSRFIFTSSTSVYAQNDGSWVTEESPAEPERETGQVLRETEDLVLGSPGGIVARLAGIYGPGRTVYRNKLLEGSAVIEGDGQRYINHIHQEDAASALDFLGTAQSLLGKERNQGTSIYNVCDDRPLTQLECYQGLAERFGKPLPPYGPRDLQRKRGVTSKRVSNLKLRSLGWAPCYPSFTDAL